MPIPKIKLWMFLGGNPTDSSTWGLPTDISDKIRYPGSDGGQAINYSGGRQDEAARVDASRMTLTLDNRDGRFSISNPLGPYYGRLRRGTPLVLATEGSRDDFNRTGALGNGWSASTFTANGSAATVTFASAGSISRPIRTGSELVNGEGRFTAWVDQVATGNAFVLGATIRATSNLNNVQIRTEFGTDGNVVMAVARLVDNVITYEGTSPAIGTYAAGQRIRVRWQADGGRVRIKAWKPANLALPDADEPLAWNLSVSMTYAPGALQGLLAWRLSGNTNTGMNGFIDDLSSEVYEFVGQVASLPMTWDRSGNNSWASLEAAGPMRRLQQGAGALQSPLRRLLSSYRPTGYWPLEDGNDATMFGSAVSGVGPGNAADVNFAADSTLAGALIAPTFNEPTSRITGNTQKRRPLTGDFRKDGTGWSVIFLTKLQQATTGNTLLAVVYSTGFLRRWKIWLMGGPVGPVNYRVETYDKNGVQVEDITLGAPNVNYLAWVAWHLAIDQRGGLTLWELNTAQVGSTSYYQMSGGADEGGLQTSVTAVTVGGNDLDGMAVAHLWTGPTPFEADPGPVYNRPFLTPDFMRVAAGYRGELAGDRARRISQEQGTPLILESGTVEAMGAQRAGSFLDNMRATEDAEYGVLYESGTGLGFRPRGARYQRVVDFTLAKAAGEISDVPQATEDDQSVRNSWTASREGGSSVTARDEEHIAREGLYEDSVTLNVAKDSALPGHASWRTYLGTRPGYRWPSVVLDLNRNPRLVAPWRSRAYGHRFRLDMGGQLQIPGEQPDLILEGWSVQLWPHGWRVDANCSPAAWWDVPTVVTSATDTSGALTDSGQSTLSGPLSTSTTNLGVLVGNPVGWVAPIVNPFEIIINGEVMTVTNTTPLSTPVGGSQTFIVTRAVNGISRAHPAGSVVSLFKPTYVGL